jgi:predicted phage terminase large subunit-like protein
MVEEIKNQNSTTISTELIDRMITDRKVRTAIVRQSHFYFFNFYFAHYIKYPTAPFHRRFFQLTEQEDIKNLFIVAFRGSAKSSIFTMSYPLWAILGQQQKKFVLIVCQTRTQAKQHMMNLRRELEGNTLLKNDLGPFQEENDEWGSVSLVFSKLNARITAASSEQSIRGLRHNQHRPDLIIGDDLEDMASVKTKEGRQKTYQWFTGEAIPAGDKNTRIIVVGNLLHEDSLLMHLKQNIDEGLIDGVFKSYPLINDEGKVAWPGKYPTKSDIETEKKKTGNENAWQREYLLKIVSEEDQVVTRDMIHYYDTLPDDPSGYRITLLGVDLAISQKENADKTAMVAILIHGFQKDVTGYVLPGMVNARLNFRQTLEKIKELYISLSAQGHTKVSIEKVQYQAVAIEQLRNEGIYDVDGVVVTTDKRSRLASCTGLLATGKIKFPRHGSEELISQLIGFGVERYDDAVDAFTLAAREFIAEYIEQIFAGVMWAD